MKTETFRQAQWRYENATPDEDAGDFQEWLSEQDTDYLLALRLDRPDLAGQIETELYARDCEDE